MHGYTAELRPAFFTLSPTASPPDARPRLSNKLDTLQHPTIRLQPRDSHSTSSNIPKFHLLFSIVAPQPIPCFYFFFLRIRPPPRSPLFPYPTLFRPHPGPPPRLPSPVAVSRPVVTAAAAAWLAAAA